MDRPSIQLPVCIPGQRNYSLHPSSSGIHESHKIVQCTKQQLAITPVPLQAILVLRIERCRNSGPSAAKPFKSCVLCCLTLSVLWMFLPCRTCRWNFSFGFVKCLEQTSFFSWETYLLEIYAPLNCPKSEMAEVSNFLNFLNTIMRVRIWTAPPPLIFSQH